MFSDSCKQVEQTSCRTAPKPMLKEVLNNKTLNKFFNCFFCDANVNVFLSPPRYSFAIPPERMCLLSTPCTRPFLFLIIYAQKTF